MIFFVILVVIKCSGGEKKTSNESGERDEADEEDVAIRDTALSKTKDLETATKELRAKTHDDRAGCFLLEIWVQLFFCLS